ncbi:MAG: PAS domain S-box protein, partial [Cyanobacteria bacterium J06641_5]
NEAPLKQTLAAIIALAELQVQQPGCRAAVLVLDERDRYLQHVAAPNLPDSYTQALDERVLGDDPVAYATALHRLEPVIVADLASDANWRDDRELALAHDLRACWSLPISIANLGVLGILTLYFDVPCQPTTLDWQALESILALARLCLERDNSRRICQRLGASMEAAIDGVAILTEADRYSYLNAAHCHLYGYDSPAELIGKTWRELYALEEIQLFEREVFPQLRQEGSWRGEVIGKRRDGSQFPTEISLTLTGDRDLICVCRDISDRNAADLALRESEQRFRTIVELNNSFLYKWDLIADTLYWSGDDVERALNYAPGTFPTTFSAWQEILHPDDLPRVLAAVARHLETGAPYYQEYRVRHANGEYRHWSDRGAVLRDATGKPAIWIGANSDISDRKQTEIALRESQQRYAALTESAPVGIFHADLQGNCLYVNDRWSEMSGLSQGEARGFGWTRSLHPEDRGRVTTEWYSAVQERSPFSLEYRCQRPEDGRITWVFGQAAAEYAPDGTHVGYIGTITDISLRKETEEALKHSRQLLRQVIDNIPQVISWTDPKSVYMGCNQRAAEMAGLDDPAEIIGKRDRDLAWAPGQAEWALHCAQRTLASDQPELHVVESLHQPDGQQRWFDTNRIPLHDDAGKVTGLLVTLEDITNRLAAERQLQSFSASLRHLHRLSTGNFQNMEDLLAAYLQAGCEMLDLPVATIARLT